MTCIVLAAGYATRLYPLTENFPKPLLPIHNKTILDWLLDDIDQANIDQYVIISNHKYIQHFNEWASDKKLNAPIVVIDDKSVSNETRLGAVKDIQFAIEELDIDDDLLVIAGDNVLDFSLTEFINYANSKETSCVMRYYEAKIDKLRKCGVVKINEDDLILKMVEKPAEPESNWCCPPFYYYTKQDTKLVKCGIESGCGYDAPGSYVSWLCTQSRVYAMEMPGKRYDIGDISSYNIVQEIYKGVK